MAAIMSLDINKIPELPGKIMAFRRAMYSAMKDPDQLTFPGFDDVESAMEVLLQHFDKHFNIITINGKYPSRVNDGLIVKENVKFAINPGGDVQRNEILKIIHTLGYTPKSSDEWHSRIGYNTIYFDGKYWTNWTEARAIELGFTVISGKQFLEHPALYLDRAPRV